jgi:hypothetical protein
MEMEVKLMWLPDGTILMHGKVPYDPVKAHEYYVRTRELKGRKKGLARTRELGRSSIARSPTYTVRLGGGKTVKVTEQELAEQRAYVAKRINNIKQSLAALNNKLTKMMGEARKKKVDARREAKKAPTASEKSEAARESKKYQDKHKQKLATKRKTGSKRSKAKTDPVDELTDKISQVENRLRAVVAKQRALTTATRNR